MNKQIFLLILFSLGSVWSLRADIVYPARLELTQIDESTFEVTFILPVIQGRVLRATPMLPCATLEEPVMTIDNFSKTMTWRVNCDQLYNQEIGLEGLGGTQVDILLRIEFLNGRILQTTLSPARPLYIVPSPPSVLFILKDGFTNGIEHMLSQLTLLILVLLLFPSATFRKWITLGIWFCGGLAIGLFLQLNNLFIFQDSYLYTITLGLVVMAFLLRLYDRLPEKTENWFVYALLIGVASGAGILLPEVNAGLTTGEFSLWISGAIFGTIPGLAVIFAAGYHLARARDLRRISGKGNITWLWYVLGIISFAMLVYDLSLYLVLPPPPVALTAVIFLLIGPALIRSDLAGIAIIMTASALGAVVGIFMQAPPYLAIFPVLGVLWYLITRVRAGNRLASVAIGLCGALSVGWITAANVVNTLSYPEANLVGLFVLTALVLTLVYTMPVMHAPAKSFGLIAVVVCAIYFIELSGLIEADWNEFTSLGKMPLPVISLVMLILAVIFWPRKRMIHREMNIAGSKNAGFILLLALAIIFLPFGWVGINNPGSSGEAMTQREAQSVLDNTLSNVYTAFNLEDEDELFERLSNNVDDELIDQVYLDSRRRLNAGVREGAEVTVRDIDILEILPKNGTGTDQVYKTTWVVTARIKHLQHVHHRRNKYLGDITLRPSENSWKIARINLISEDRTIVPVSSL